MDFDIYTIIIFSTVIFILYKLSITKFIEHKKEKLINLDNTIIKKNNNYNNCNSSDNCNSCDSCISLNTHEKKLKKIVGKNAFINEKQSEQIKTKYSKEALNKYHNNVLNFNSKIRHTNVDNVDVVDYLNLLKTDKNNKFIGKKISDIYDSLTGINNKSEVNKVHNLI